MEILTWHSASPQTFPRAKGPLLLDFVQNLHCPSVVTLESGSDAVLGMPFRNSTSAFRVAESARAISQKSLIRPQPSCKSTRTDSSSSLQTFLTWCQNLGFKCKTRSHSVQRFVTFIPVRKCEHSLHWITARVSSLWLSHFACSIAKHKIKAFFNRIS